MKKFIYTCGCLMAVMILLSSEVFAQAQEKPAPKTTNSELYEEDDLSPYPYAKEEPKKKTFGQKIKEGFKEEEKPEKKAAAENQTEEYIRFYEFEDVTFADREEEMEFEEENDQTGPMEDYKSEENSYIYKQEYYKDVTFEGENKLRKQESGGYDDELHSSHRKNNRTTRTQRPPATAKPAKPIEIKGENFYREDYMNYYSLRKKKGNGTPDTPPSFSNELRKSKKIIWDRINKNRAEREN